MLHWSWLSKAAMRACQFFLVACHVDADLVQQWHCIIWVQDTDRLHRNWHSLRGWCKHIPAEHYSVLPSSLAPSSLTAFLVLVCAGSLNEDKKMLSIILILRKKRGKQWVSLFSTWLPLWGKEKPASIQDLIEKERITSLNQDNILLFPCFLLCCWLYVICWQGSVGIL